MPLKRLTKTQPQTASASEPKPARRQSPAAANIPDGLMDELTGTSFKPLDTKEVPRVIMSLEGLPKTGKLHFALSAPGPIILMSTDKGHEGVANKFPGKAIVEAQYDFAPPKQVRADPREAAKW